jgi:hypothetical protein
MKKTLLLLLILSVNISAFAQNIRIGIKGGLNLSKMSLYSPNIPYPNTEILPGYQVGGIVNFGFKNFDIQPGILFSTKGYKIISQLVDANQKAAGTSTATTTFNYIEVPVNALYHITIANSISLHGGGGPYFGYGVSASGAFGGKSYDVQFTNNPSLTTASYNNPDYGINFVAGATLKNSIIIDAGYGLGLANLGYGTSTLHNRVINFSVGYLFK